MGWVYFLLGMMTGGLLGVVAMCLCIVSSAEENTGRYRKADFGQGIKRDLTKRPK